MKPVQTSLLYILVSYLGHDRVQCQIAFLPFLFTFFNYLFSHNLSTTKTGLCKVRKIPT